MFGNLNWTNVVILLLLALFIFGEKLPGMISEGLRMLRSLRRMAQNATSDLSRELGTDIRLEDLHPKTFIRKHLLSEADQRALLAPLQSVTDEVTREGRRLERELRDVRRDIEGEPGRNAGRNGRNLTPPEPPRQRPAPRPAASYDDIT